MKPGPAKHAEPAFNHEALITRWLAAQAPSPETPC